MAPMATSSTTAKQLSFVKTSVEVVSVYYTDKTATDHVVSIVLRKDCKISRVAKREEICNEIKPKTYNDEFTSKLSNILNENKMNMVYIFGFIAILFIPLLPILIASITTFVAISLLRPFAISIDLIDKPNSRKPHSGAVPLIGGIAMFFGIVVSIVVLTYDLNQYDKGNTKDKQLYFSHSYGLPYLSGIGAYYFNKKSLYFIEINTWI